MKSIFKKSINETNLIFICNLSFKTQAEEFELGNPVLEGKNKYIFKVESNLLCPDEALKTDIFLIDIIRTLVGILAILVGILVSLFGTVFPSFVVYIMTTFGLLLNYSLIYVAFFLSKGYYINFLAFLLGGIFILIGCAIAYGICWMEKEIIGLFWIVMTFNFETCIISFIYYMVPMSFIFEVCIVGISLIFIKLKGKDMYMDNLLALSAPLAGLFMIKFGLILVAFTGNFVEVIDAFFARGNFILTFYRLKYFSLYSIMLPLILYSIFVSMKGVKQKFIKRQYNSISTE